MRVSAPFCARGRGSDDHHRPGLGGAGVSVLPASFQRMRIEGVVYRTLLDEEAMSAVWLVQRERGHSVMAKAFAELLTGQVVGQA